VNPLLLYLLLAKATITSFSGLSSLPIVHNDLVIRRHVITDRQLNTAVAVARMTPGPNGLYIVCVGYYAAGIGGALAGFLAMITPAFLIIPLLEYLGRRAHRDIFRQGISAITLAAAGLVLVVTVPFARASFSSLLAVLVAAASFVALAFTRIDTLWVIACSGAVGAIRLLLSKTTIP
jgi:chromate transporter